MAVVPNIDTVLTAAALAHTITVRYYRARRVTELLLGSAAVIRRHFRNTNVDRSTDFSSLISCCQTITRLCLSCLEKYNIRQLRECMEYVLQFFSFFP